MKYPTRLAGSTMVGETMYVSISAQTNSAPVPVIPIRDFHSDGHRDRFVGCGMTKEKPSLLVDPFQVSGQHLHTSAEAVQESGGQRGVVHSTHDVALAIAPRCTLSHFQGEKNRPLCQTIFMLPTSASFRQFRNDVNCFSLSPLVGINLNAHSTRC